MTTGQTICLAVPTLMAAFWSYIFITGNTDSFQQHFGKMPSGPDTLFAFANAGIHLATMAFISLAAFFHTDAVKRLVLRAYTLSFSGLLYLAYQNKELYLADAFKMTVYQLCIGASIAFAGGFVLSPAANEKKKRF
jgi:hypothetical protein